MVGARLKLKRANQHVADIEARISALPKSYTSSIEVDPKTGGQFIKHDLANHPDVTADLALIIGDAIHNLRCALDHAWIGTLERLAPGIIGKFTKFPVYQTREDLERALRNGRVDTSVPRVFALVISQIQPYKEGNYDIWTMHQLDIRDKHRLLIPVVNFTSITGIEVEDEHGDTVRNGETWGTTQRAPFYVQIPRGWQVKEKGKVAVEVVFDEGTPADSLEILDTLLHFSRVVLQVIESLESGVG